jgi:hypothetical protein
MASRRKLSAPPGFRAAPRPRQRPIAEMSVRELQDRHALNAKILSSPWVRHIADSFQSSNEQFVFRGASSSTYVDRVIIEQRAVESRLVELVGVESISTGLKQTTIKGENDIQIDVPPEPPFSRAIAAKQKALSNFVRPYIILLCMMTLMCSTIESGQWEWDHGNIELTGSNEP